MQYSSHAESHVPCFQERVGTKHPGYMIPDRLPWRLRARPSATLHEIQVRSEERTCSHDATESWHGTSRGISGGSNPRASTTKGTKVHEGNTGTQQLVEFLGLGFGFNRRERESFGVQFFPLAGTGRLPAGLILADFGKQILNELRGHRS